MFKVCKRCGKEKPLEAFYAQVGNLDGRQGKCIECARAYANARTAANPGLDKRSFRHPGAKRLRAHNVVRGLEPEPCEVCGDPAAEKHHPDYDRPLLVRWLCKVHHGELHQRYAA
jgi:hypothetical protein